MDMEGNRNQNLSSSSLCRTGCGFYGNQSFDGMCSKCYKDALKRKQAAAPVNGRSTPTTASPSELSSIGASNVCSSTLPPPPLDVAPVTVTSSSSSSSMTTPPCVETATPTVPVVIVGSPSHEDDDKSNSDAKSEDGAIGGSPSANSSCESPESSSDKDKKPKKNRCNTCKKKVGLTGFQCRCGGLYCSVHRYSDKHNCDFDYKEMAAEQIRRNNPVVVGEKVQKI